MTFETVSKVVIPGVGKITHRQDMTVDDDTNVFGRAYEYRQMMKKQFPGCDYELVTAKPKEGGK